MTKEGTWNWMLQEEPDMTEKLSKGHKQELRISPDKSTVMRLSNNEMVVMGDLYEQDWLWIASQIISQVNGMEHNFGWGDTDPVAWKLEVGNSFHDFDAIDPRTRLGLQEMRKKIEIGEAAVVGYMILRLVDWAS